MKESFEAIKDAICDKTALYIPSADGEYTRSIATHQTLE